MSDFELSTAKVCAGLVSKESTGPEIFPANDLRENFPIFAGLRCRFSSWLQLWNTSVNVLWDEYHGEREAGIQRPAGPQRISNPSLHHARHSCRTPHRVESMEPFYENPSSHGRNSDKGLFWPVAQGEADGCPGWFSGSGLYFLADINLSRSAGREWQKGRISSNRFLGVFSTTDGHR